MFAPLHQLGWDPTMERVAGTKQYNITVRDNEDRERKYRTLRLVSCPKIEALRGTATRVWECVPLDARGRTVRNKRVALKDTWSDLDRRQEGDTYTELRAHASPPQREILNKHLLTVEFHGIVYVDEQPATDRKSVV